MKWKNQKTRHFGGVRVKFERHGEYDTGCSMGNDKDERSLV